MLKILAGAIMQGFGNTVLFTDKNSDTTTLH